MQKEINLNRILRIAGVVAIIIAVIFLLKYLSNVLMPFFVAWALAYLIYPLVKFVQYKMKVKNRVVSIIISLLFIIIIVGGFIALFSGEMIEQLKQLGKYIDNFVKMHTESDSVSMYIKEWLRDNREEITQFVQGQDMAGALKSALPQLWIVISETYNVIIGFGVVLMALLYMFFILLDYEYLTQNWIKIFPKSVRPFWHNVAIDVEKAMNSYVRGQSLVAFTMGVLFCIGFTIIDFPMAIGLGILIGIMDLVPYLHTFALIPTAFLALMKAANTGQNFFFVFGLAVLVFCVVQVIIDMVVTPKIMGKAMGMNPAILLLALSVWGSLLGFIGLIIALPLTTILMAYYRRYVTREDSPTPALPLRGGSEPSSEVIPPKGGKEGGFYSIIAFLLPLLFTSCITEEQHSTNAKGCFESMWKIVDEHYCFFDYKAKEYGLNWDDVYKKYQKQFENEKLSSYQTYELLTSMLSELRDGHVNLSTAFDYGRYWAWHEDFPKNFSDTLQRNYLGTDYHIASSLRYRILDDNIGYIYYGSFQSAIGDGNLDAVLSELASCNGLIIDVRDNGGGMLTLAEKLAARFTNEELLVGYMQHKTGKGHNDFSDMQPQILKPSSGIRWQKKVAVLTNRSVFSAANEFVKYMKCCPNTVIIGDKTGGGAGMPFSSELPNGWSIRFSACPIYDKNKQSTEFGIEPDIKVDITSADFSKGIDTIIETARQQLH